MRLLRPLAPAEPLPGRTGPAAVALGQLLLHLLTHQRYGYFRDELYYLACGRHLAWGYVDHPPFGPLVAWLASHTLGESLLALRLGPALATAAVVLLAGLMARELGGGRFAQLAAALTVALSPAYLIMGSFLSINSFDILWWAAAQYLIVRLLNDGRRRWWPLLGLVMGVGLLTKYSMLFLGLGLLAGLLLTPQRRQLAAGGVWLAAAIALAIAAPHVVWQYRHGWPTLEFLQNIRLYKNYPVTAVEFVAMQAVVLNPLVFVVAMIGLGCCLFSPAARQYRLVGWIYVVVAGTLMVLKAKFYYLFPAYPMLLAAGATAVERRIGADGRSWAKQTVVAVLLVGYGAFVPYGAPVLSLDMFDRYDRALGINRLVHMERGRSASKHVVYSDMLGWPELVEAVAGVRDGLAAGERAEAVVLVSNYGQAGAVDLFGRRHGLPPAVSGHNSYYEWGPGSRPWNVVIAVGFPAERLAEMFEEVSPAGTVYHTLAREGTVRIHVCRRPKAPVSEVWPTLKRFG